MLLDEIERLSLVSTTEIEGITVAAKGQAYHRLNDTEAQQQALIAELRGRLARENAERFRDN